MDEDKVAAAFTEWWRQVKEDPEGFYSEDEMKAADAGDLGRLCQKTLFRVMKELEGS